jgi:hypothetical protein
MRRDIFMREIKVWINIEIKIFYKIFRNKQTEVFNNKINNKFIPHSLNQIDQIFWSKLSEIKQINKNLKIPNNNKILLKTIMTNLIVTIKKRSNQ